MRATATLATWVLMAGCLNAEEPPRHAERTPALRVVPVHTLERAGNPHAVAPWARPGVGRYETGGYVGGGSLKARRAEPHSVPGVGPTESGTFGWDFVGFCVRPSRFFLAPSAERPRTPEYHSGYETEGHRVPDVFALRPIRRAVLACKEEKAHRTEGEKERGEHGKEGSEPRKEGSERGKESGKE